MNISDHIPNLTSFRQLINEAIDFIENSPFELLPLKKKFSGSGVYMLYYTGDFKVYKDIYANYQDLPIYVGKAVLPGWRQGRLLSKEGEPALFRRINEHARSIETATNINLLDFQYKFMILFGEQADLISVIETALIRKFVPLWNSYVDGFGNHDPGKGRYNQAKSEWDVLHPGRQWADRLTGTPPSINIIMEKIGRYYDNLSG